MHPYSVLLPYEKLFCSTKFGVGSKAPRLKEIPKTVAENWDSKTTSVGNILAYLETTALIIVFVFQVGKLKFSASL
jgi:hypothetical protein